MGLTQHWDPSSYSFNSLPKPSVLRLFSSISSRFCPFSFPEPRLSYCKLKFMHWPFKLHFFVSSHQSLAESNPATFHTWMSSQYFLGSGTLVWGIPAECLHPHFLSGIHQPLKHPSNTSAAACGHPASPLMSPLHSLSVTSC